MNLLNTSIIRGLISHLKCENNTVKLNVRTRQCSNKAMFIDSHTQNSKNERISGRDAIFYLLCEDIRCRRVRWSEEQLCQRAIYQFRMKTDSRTPYFQSLSKIQLPTQADSRTLVSWRDIKDLSTQVEDRQQNPRIVLVSWSAIKNLSTNSGWRPTAEPWSLGMLSKIYLPTLQHGMYLDIFDSFAGICSHKAVQCSHFLKTWA